MNTNHTSMAVITLIIRTDEPISSTEVIRVGLTTEAAIAWLRNEAVGFIANREGVTPADVVTSGEVIINRRKAFDKNPAGQPMRVAAQLDLRDTGYSWRGEAQGYTITVQEWQLPG